MTGALVRWARRRLLVILLERMPPGDLLAAVGTARDRRDHGSVRAARLAARRGNLDRARCS